ncbi:MAG: hypothetical protein HZC25_08415 [Rhodospirillales bacterium]|nr:hypothetical protein [Rhodospirillales bacterium]
MHPDAGEGPLAMTYRTKANYDTYLRQDAPIGFAVTLDGAGSAWTYCPHGTACMQNSFQAISYCESLNQGKKCKLYGIGRDVVWEGPVSLRPDDKQMTTSSTVTSNAPSQPPTTSITRPFAAKWAGYDDLIAGTVAIIAGKDGGTIAFQLPRNEGFCQGGFLYGQKGTGTWSAACTSGITATGTFEGLERDKGSYGSGTDSKGRAISFTIGGQPEKPSTMAAPANAPALTGQDRSSFLLSHQVDCVRRETQSPLVTQLGIPESKIKTFCECRGEALADLLSLDDIKTMIGGTIPASITEKMVYQSAACSEKAGIVTLPR